MIFGRRTRKSNGKLSGQALAYNSALKEALSRKTFILILGALLTFSGQLMALDKAVDSGSNYFDDGSGYGGGDDGGGGGNGGGLDTSNLAQVNVTADTCGPGLINIVDDNSDLIGCDSYSSGSVNGSVAVADSGNGSLHVSNSKASTANQNHSQNPKSPCDKKATSNATTTTDPIDTSSGSKIDKVIDFAEPGEWD